MKKFSHETLRKYIIPSFVLGGILLFTLISPSFVDASICHSPDCHYPTTTTTQPPCTTTTTCPPTTTTTTIPPTTTTTTICHSPSVNISAAPISVSYNGSATLHWTSSNTNYCTTSASPYNYQWNSGVDLNGDKSIYNLTQTTTFTITCTGNCGTVTDSVTVYTQDPITRYACNYSTYQCYETTSGPYVSYNDCTNACQAPITRYACNYSTYQCYQTTSGSYISYNDCANACQQTNQSLSVSCSASPNPAQTNQTVTFSSNVSGGSGNYSYYWSGATYGNSSYSQKSFSSNGNYTAYLTVNDSQNRSGSASCSVNVGNQCTNTGALSLWADNYTIAQGESTYLRWTSSNMNYCTASNGWSGSKSTSGYESVSPNSNTTYSLTCYGSCGQVTRSITIYTTSVSTNLSLTKLGRNLSNGDRVYSKVIRVTEGDVIEFYLTITAGNNRDLYNVNIKDIMPSVLSYMPSTTKINGVVQADTIATTGLSLGTIYKGASKTIVFQAISLSSGTYLTYTNTAEVTADNETKITDSASITYGLVAGAATIRTGPLNTLLISLIISLISALIIWYYLKFNPKGQLVFARSENKIRDIWLAYTRRRIMRRN